MRRVLAVGLVLVGCGASSPTGTNSPAGLPVAATSTTPTPAPTPAPTPTPQPAPTPQPTPTPNPGPTSRDMRLTFRLDPAPPRLVGLGDRLSVQMDGCWRSADARLLVFVRDDGATFMNAETRGSGGGTLICNRDGYSYGIGFFADPLTASTIWFWAGGRRISRVTALYGVSPLRSNETETTCGTTGCPLMSPIWCSRSGAMPYLNCKDEKINWQNVTDRFDIEAGWELQPLPPESEWPR